MTRAKSGISKKKVFLSTEHALQMPASPYYDEVEPTCLTEASKIEAWRNAMAVEFSALQ